MKKITLTIITLLIIQLINAQQTITTYSTGYNYIEGITINSNNQVFVSEHYSGKVYSIDNATGNKSEYASTGFYTNDIVFNGNDDLFIIEPFMGKIFIKNSTADASVYVDVTNPHGLAIDNNGDLYFSSFGKVVKINSDLSMTDYATGFSYAEGIAFDSNNNLYLADRSDRKLYKIEPNGTKTVVASGISSIRGVAIDQNDNVYFTKSQVYPVENKILKYDPITNVVSDFVTTNLDSPRYIAIDNLGNMYVTNRETESVVKINDPSLNATGTTTEEQLTTFTIYPNPATNSLTIESNIIINNVSIYNELGQLLLKTNKTNIDISTLTKGIYYLKITNEIGNIEIKKVVKQ